MHPHVYSSACNYTWLLRSNYRAPFLAVINSVTFWDSMAQSSNAFDLICKCIGSCESDSASLSTSFAFFPRTHAKFGVAIFSAAYNSRHMVASEIKPYPIVFPLLVVCFSILSIFLCVRRLRRRSITSCYRWTAALLNFHFYLALRILTNVNARYDVLLEEFFFMRFIVFTRSAAGTKKTRPFAPPPYMESVTI